jgi:hypothetical protein
MSTFPDDPGILSFAVWTCSGSQSLPPIILYSDRTVAEKLISSYMESYPYVLTIRCASLTTKVMTLYSKLLAQSRYELCLDSSGGSLSMTLNLSRVGIGL